MESSNQLITKLPEGEVILGYIHRPLTHHTMTECLLKLQSEKIGINEILHEQCFFVAGGRNRIVTQFLERPNAKWLLFVDDDIWFTTDNIRKLYSMADEKTAPIVGGLYFGRLGAEGGFSNTILPVWLNKSKDPKGVFESVNSIQGEGLQKVDVLGMGFTLIHRSVLEKLRQVYNEEEDPWVWFGHDLFRKKRIGEDATFCLRALDLGYPIYGVPEIVLPHFKDHVYTAQMFLSQTGLFK